MDLADEQTTVACDGKIKIYDMSDSTPLLLKIIEGVVASSEPECVPSAWSRSQQTEEAARPYRAMQPGIHQVVALLCPPGLTVRSSGSFDLWLFMCLYYSRNRNHR